ncbi:MerR family transcriptional regulator [Actinocorallia sp. A-T 12471]|uniref:MerR family transcriptional regulator n=1 Tax=Actinocorallia sp. A-T 12471 TaxID=3089813 RepID=UPI0029CCC90F|nr:MerR family transcriptional regulator [Actinocorallia sp. A-T 12471]MDX6742297.1 MerR family transcriptional regulator [Actinocorallia sp. A-T 12471]
MRIGDAAAAAGTTARALRFYEERGLLKPPRTASGQRDYGPREIRRVRAIRLLLSFGLTVEDVRAAAPRLAVFDSDDFPAFGTEGCDGSGGVATARLAALDAEITRLTTLRTRLAKALTPEDPPPPPPHNAV